MVAFNSGGNPNPHPQLPGQLIGSRVHGQRRASASHSRSSTPTPHTTAADSEPWQSMADLMRKPQAKATLGTAAELNAALPGGAQPLDAGGYGRTASLPHVPTQPLLPTDLLPPSALPANHNPRKVPRQHTDTV